MRFKSAGTSTKMSILTGGNVGIGTTTPSTALDVIGAIKNSSYIHQDADSSTTQLREVLVRPVEISKDAGVDPAFVML